MLLIRKLTFCQKVTVDKDQKIPFISNLKKPTCASKRDVLELATFIQEKAPVIFKICHYWKLVALGFY